MLPVQEGKGKLLRRTSFAATLERLPAPRRWPVGTGGEAVGGEELRGRLGGTLTERPLSPTAVDACWVALSGGNPYVSGEEVTRQLSRWRPAAATFELEAFERSLLQVR